MEDIKSFKQKVFSISRNIFEGHALSLFRFQVKYNKIYNKYIANLGINSDRVRTIEEIPFLPISLFRYHEIKTGYWTEEAVFESSGTTAEVTSRHYINDLSYYDNTALEIFRRFYGDPENYIFLALLPSYLERRNSSLIQMIDFFIKKSGSTDSGFFLHDHEQLIKKIKNLTNHSNRIIILWGVTYALIDLANLTGIDLNNSIIIETGGMKGRRDEMVTEEVHGILKKQFKVKNIHSEYGMTELLSQAYSRGEGRFLCPPWLKIYIRDINDPFNVNNKIKYGGVNIIDLANVHSCAFIETQDLGKINDDGTFEIIGRIDNSDLRGCNLLLN